MHAATLMPNGNIWQAMGGLKNVTPPYMRVSGRVQVNTFMLRALNANLFDSRDIQLLPHPPGKVFVRGLLYLFIKQAIVKLRYSGFKFRTESVHFAAWKMRPSVRRCASHCSKEAVAMQSSGSVPDGQDIDVPCGFEPSRSCKESSNLHT
jgi:hypothetical protein